MEKDFIQLRFASRPINGVDECTSSSLKILSFDSYSEEWLDFILKCRRKQDSSDYDIVMGGVANDKVFNTVELYFDHLIDKQEAIKRLRYEKPNMQICFRSERALKQLHFEVSFEIGMQIRFGSKKNMQESLNYLPAKRKFL